MEGLVLTDMDDGRVFISFFILSETILLFLQIQIIYYIFIIFIGRMLRWLKKRTFWECVSKNT